MGGKSWSVSEIEFLKSNYPKKEQSYILKYLVGRSWKSISLKARIMGIFREKEAIGRIRAETNLKRYGVENTFQSKSIKEKIKKVNISKHGVENPMQAKEVQDKVKETNLKRYGVENTFQSKSIKEKSCRTTLARYGCLYPQQSQVIRNKTKVNNLNKWGFESPMQSKEIQDKTKATNLKKYGVENPMQSKEIQDKVKATNLKRYGVENTFQSESIKEKIQKVNLSRHGVGNPMQSKDVQDKAKETNLKKYGVEYTFQSERVKKKIAETNLLRYNYAYAIHSEIIKNKNIDKWGVPYKQQLSEIKNKIVQTNLKRYGVEYITQLREIQDKIHETKKKNGSYGKSKEEDYLYELLLNIFPRLTIERQYAELRYPFNCDFYIKELDFFIEYQGYFHHSKEPYDGVNLPKDWVEKAKTSKNYRNALKTFTTADPIKRDQASYANLNFLEIWESDLQKGEEWLTFLFLKQGLPLNYPEKVCRGEFSRISKHKGNFSSNTHQNKIIKFFQPHFYRKERELWNHPKIREKLVTNREKYKFKDKIDITSRQYLQGFKISGIHVGYSFFSPLWVKSFIDKYKIKSIYDPCMGWGHRLLGAQDITYIGNDSCPETYQGNKNISKYFDLKDKTFYNQPAEDLIPEEPYDAVFTCPPYFDTEIYSGDSTSKI